MITHINSKLTFDTSPHQCLHFSLFASKCRTLLTLTPPSGAGFLMDSVHSYAKLSHQQICNIKVTDQLSKAINDAGRFLWGPVCSLTFKLQSGNTEDPELETVCLEIDQPMDDTQLLESGSAGGSILEGNASSQCLNSSSETVVPPNSPPVVCIAAHLLLHFRPRSSIWLSLLLATLQPR